MIRSEMTKVKPNRGLSLDKEISFDEEIAVQAVFYQEEVEPNNTLSQANPMDNSRLSGGEYALVGWMNTSSDADYYRFQVSTGGIIEFVSFWADSYANAGREGDLYLTIYDSTGKVLGTQGVAGSGADMYCYIFGYINAGTYYLKVSASQQVGNTYVGEPYLVFTEFYRDTSIPDANLKATLSAILGVSGRNLTELDMWQLESVDISGKSIRNLTGMEDAWYLEMLDASNNLITNLTPLASLPNLFLLFLNKNPGLSNLGPLALLNGLEHLQFGGTAVADISPIRTLPNLAALAVGGDWFSDLTQLSGMTNLEALAVVESPLVHELTPLAGLNNLEFLIVSGTLVQDFSPLTSLQNLWGLILSDNRISDVSPLSDWQSGLVDLDLSNNEIVDIGPVVDFQKNGALSENSVLSVRYNDLDLSPDSAVMNDIAYLESEGVTVLYEPQKRVARIAGTNRYKTANAVSREGWLNGADTVILARGDNYADALAGVPLAYLLDAPILLTASSQLTPIVLSEIQRLGATKVVILGGTGAVSANVEAALIAAGLTVERLAGSGRYDTAVLIAGAMQAAGAEFSSAVMAVGTNFPDALAAASYAAMTEQPILLTGSTALPAATEAALTTMEIDELLLVGGVSVISTDVEAYLGTFATVERIFGANRYETAIALAEKFAPVTDRYYIATGADFPDAITGAVLAAKSGTGVILVNGKGTVLNSAVQDFFGRVDIPNIRLFGGVSVINTTIENWFWDYTE